MIPLDGEEAGRALGLAALAQPVVGVSTDTRTLQPGDLYVALRGERHDGHDFVDAAFAAGASGAVVQEGHGAAPLRGPLYPVPDTLAALGALAAAVRSKSAARVLGITGSVGKTSTKDILRTLASVFGPVVATHANENNEVGVPLTLLRLEPGTASAVVEMGMRGRGQIAALASIARPQVGLITKIAPVHLELLGTLDEIAAAKAELLSQLQPAGVGVVPYSAPYEFDYFTAGDARVVRFGFGPGEEAADVWGAVRRGDGNKRVLELRWDEGEAEVELSWSSRHRFENAVGALAAAHAAGWDPAQCLAVLPETVFTPLRGDEFESGAVLVLDDTYNANPAAMRSALDTLRDRAGDRGGRAVAILGDMLELGPDAERFHREVGLYAADSGVDILWAVGAHSRAVVESFCSAVSARQEGRDLTDSHLEDEECREIGLRMGSRLRPGDAVLVKASRGLRLERVVEGLRRSLSPGAEVPAESEGRDPGVRQPREEG
jgi:UDP-N-acetylmuramoyl-tripeptide--D-alanyl-D-alanine ligase